MSGVFKHYTRAWCSHPFTTGTIIGICIRFNLLWV